MKYLSNIVKEFENFLYKGNVRNGTKHDPSDSCLYLVRQIFKCMMRDDALNLHVDPVRTEITGTQQIPILQVCSSGKSESKRILADENVSQACSTDESEQESVIVDESYM